MVSWLEKVNALIWSVPALSLILAAGIYYSVRTSFLQIRLLPKSLIYFFKSITSGNKKQGISPYRAVCTALAATVGTGNLAGVAGAICIGGPGAIFWMWICGILGMIIKFAEATLAVTIRRKSCDGHWIGGPMYLIKDGLSHGWGWLAGVYCFFGVVASFGVGNTTQINTVVGSVNNIFLAKGLKPTMYGNVIMGLVMALLICFTVHGGAKKIGATAEKLIPFASILYILLAFGVLFKQYHRIPAALQQIFQGAFAPKAVTGGAIGSAFLTLRIGASRGVFTNEAGMGTASIAHAGAEVTHPVSQGMMGLVEVLLDTLVICTLTALVILCSGVPIGYGEDAGITLTTNAFSGVYGEWIRIVLSLSLCCFAYATVLGWGLYGSACAEYLFGEQAKNTYVVAQGVFVVIGATMRNDVLWTLSELVNGLMAIPNLIALLLLSPVLMKQIDAYKKLSARH